MDIAQAKHAAAAAALTRVEDGMTLGLGTGSTAAAFVDLLGERVSAGLTVSGVATSEATREHAGRLGVEIIEPDETTIIDLAIDGADEVAPNLALIKGGGGALLREKIVAEAARQFIVIADQSKRVETLGAFALPVEIDCFSWGLTTRRLRETLAQHGFAGAAIALRAGSQGAPFLSDGGNYILDCALRRIPDPASLDRALHALPGVVETGLFVDLADRAIIAGPDGVHELTRG